MSMTREQIEQMQEAAEQLGHEIAGRRVPPSRHVRNERVEAAHQEIVTRWPGLMEKLAET